MQCFRGTERECSPAPRVNHNKVQEPPRAPKSGPHPRETKISSHWNALQSPHARDPATREFATWRHLANFMAPFGAHDLIFHTTRERERERMREREREREKRERDREREREREIER
eukprot:sb/3476592/